MELSLRLETLLGALGSAEIFADVGCDHGYVAAEMLARDKCRFAYLTDISAKSLKKAEEYLSGRFPGRFLALATNGLQGVPRADEVLVAGMGGEEIVSILSSSPFLPERIVLQPMKNSEKVRSFLLRSGYAPTADYTFYDGKYYDLISAEKGECVYTADEIAFGRDNLREKGDAFLRMIGTRRAVLLEALPRMKKEEREKAEKRIGKYDEVLG